MVSTGEYNMFNGSEQLRCERLQTFIPSGQLSNRKVIKLSSRGQNPVELFSFKTWYAKWVQTAPVDRLIVAQRPFGNAQMQSKKKN